MAPIQGWVRLICVLNLLGWGVLAPSIAQADSAVSPSGQSGRSPIEMSEPQNQGPADATPVSSSETNSELNDMVINDGITDQQSAPSVSDHVMPAESDAVSDTATPEPLSNSPDAERRSWLAQLINKSEIDLAVFNSVRIDDLQWSIAGNSAGTNPDIRSELTWSDVHSQQVTFAGRALYNRMVYLRGELNYAWVQNGRVCDSDYNSDDRNDEYSRSISQANGDQLWDLSLAGGYPFLLINNRMLVAPLLGYSYHVQNYRITNGEQVITWPEGPPLGELTGLDSTYRTRWMGPWLGCDLRYRFERLPAGDPPMELSLALEVHWAEYYGEANWNLRSDLDHPTSFEHDADGMGYIIACEWLIQLAAQWDLAVRFNYQHWLTDHGTDRIHHASGTTTIQRLNEVEWNTRSFMLGVTYHF